MKKCSLNNVCKPKNNDILVLAKNRNVIYSYNGNNHKTYNAFNVAVHFLPNMTCVTVKQDNNSVTAYDAPWDYATKDEIEKFNKAVSDYNKRLEPTEDDDKILDHFAIDFNEYMKMSIDVTDHAMEEMMLDEISDDLYKLRENILRKYRA